MSDIRVYDSDNKQDSIDIRIKVFVEEQGYKNEIDEIDEYCDYITVKSDGRCIATGRLFRDENCRSTFIFGRIAVLKEYRGMGFGKIVLEELEKLAKKKGAEAAVLHAQEYAVPFYSKYGFELTEDPVEYDEGQPHRKMYKKL